MKNTRRYILLFSCAAMLSGCGVDVGRIFILIKEAGGWQQLAAGYAAAEAAKAGGAAQAQKVVYIGQSSGPAASSRLQDMQKQIVDSINAAYGPAAAKESQAEFEAMNTELFALAAKAKNDKDFLAKQKQIIGKHSANIQAILLKYPKQAH